jgi:hypothetical protein
MPSAIAVPITAIHIALFTNSAKTVGALPPMIGTIAGAALDRGRHARETVNIVTAACARADVNEEAFECAMATMGPC